MESTLEEDAVKTDEMTTEDSEYVDTFQPCVLQKDHWWREQSFNVADFNGVLF